MLNAIHFNSCAMSDTGEGFSEPCTVHVSERAELLYFFTKKDEIGFAKDEVTAIVVDLIVPLLDAEQLVQIANEIHSRMGVGNEPEK